jgi:hypothetical protein
MVHGDDVYVLPDKPVDNAVGSVDHFTDKRVVYFGNHTPGLRELRQMFD